MGVIVESLEDSYFPTLMRYASVVGDRYLIATRVERTGGAGQFATVHDLDTHTHQVFTIRAPGGATLDDGGPQTQGFAVNIEGGLLRLTDSVIPANSRALLPGVIEG